MAYKSKFKNYNSSSQVTKVVARKGSNSASKKDKDVAASGDNFVDSCPSKVIDGTFTIKGKKLKVDLPSEVLKHPPGIGLVALRISVSGKSSIIPFCIVTEESVTVLDDFRENVAEIGLSYQKINALRNEVAKLWCKKVVLGAFADKIARKEAALKAKRERRNKP